MLTELAPLSMSNFRLVNSLFYFEAGCYVVRAGFKNEDGHEIWDTTRVYIDLE